MAQMIYYRGQGYPLRQPTQSQYWAGHARLKNPIQKKKVNQVVSEGVRALAEFRETQLGVSQVEPSLNAVVTGPDLTEQTKMALAARLRGVELQFSYPNREIQGQTVNPEDLVLRVYRGVEGIQAYFEETGLYKTAYEYLREQNMNNWLGNHGMIRSYAIANSLSLFFYGTLLLSIEAFLKVTTEYDSMPLLTVAILMLVSLKQKSTRVDAHNLMESWGNWKKRYAQEVVPELFARDQEYLSRLKQGDSILDRDWFFESYNLKRSALYYSADSEFALVDDAELLCSGARNHIIGPSEKIYPIRSKASSVKRTRVALDRLWMMEDGEPLLIVALRTMARRESYGQIEPHLSMDQLRLAQATSPFP